MLVSGPRPSTTSDCLETWASHLPFLARESKGAGEIQVLKLSGPSSFLLG